SEAPGPVRARRLSPGPRATRANRRRPHAPPRATPPCVPGERRVQALAVGAYFLERNRVAPERLRVIHNGVDVERFATRGDGGETRRELGVPDDAWVIGLVGSLRAQKNHAVLLRALARLLPEVPDARLVLA